MGAASLHLGLAKATDDIAPSGGAGGNLSFAADFGRVRPAVEFGGFDLGGRDAILGPEESLHYDESLRYIGSSVAVGPASGTVRPYALASVGLYRWKAAANFLYVLEPGFEDLSEQTAVMLRYGNSPVYQHAFVGASLGCGVRVRAARALSFGAEARWHTNLSEGPHMEPNTHRRFSVVSLTGGATLRW
jgi:hypothetical protein